MSSKSNALTATGVGMLATLFMSVFALLEAWIVMLGFGDLHDVWPAVPAVGYWTAYVFSLLLYMVIRPVFKPKTEKV